MCLLTKKGRKKFLADPNSTIFYVYLSSIKNDDSFKITEHGCVSSSYPDLFDQNKKISSGKDCYICCPTDKKGFSMQTENEWSSCRPRGSLTGWMKKKPHKTDCPWVSEVVFDKVPGSKDFSKLLMNLAATSSCKTIYCKEKLTASILAASAFNLACCTAVSPSILAASARDWASAFACPVDSTAAL